MKEEKCCGTGRMIIMLAIASVFQDHMILQRNKPIRVWGTTEPFAQVQAEIGIERASAYADADGGWMLELPPREASTGNRLFIASGQDQIELHDVNVGEVWLAGGQSNMEFHMKFDKDYDAVLNTAFFRDMASNSSVE